MLKRTLYFGNPAYLYLKDLQLKIDLNDGTPIRSVPMEDIGVVVLDHYGLKISQPAVVSLLEHKAVVIFCDNAHLPTGIMLPMEGNHLMQKRLQTQVNASEPLKKQLWQQTIKAKIANQAAHLASYGHNVIAFEKLRDAVRSGDTDNIEAQAANKYWGILFESEQNFRRRPEGAFPNPMLNYAYALLRATMARAIVGAGLLPYLGIFHKSQYNAFPLADDLMEPYRPWADALVYRLYQQLQENEPTLEELSPALKAKLLQLLTHDCKIEGENSLIWTAMQRTAFSLVKCFAKESKKLVYPDFNPATYYSFK